MVNGKSVRTMKHIEDIAKIKPRREFLLKYGKLDWYYYCNTYRMSRHRGTYYLCRNRANHSRIRKIGKRNKKTGVIYK